LTPFTVFRKTFLVSSKFQALLAEVRALASERGTKQTLAKRLRVPQSRLSEWLKRKHEPGAETTLEMLAWVDEQKNPEKRSNATRAMTQLRSPKHETKKSGRKKR
jgi:hypothetical protein